MKYLGIDFGLRRIGLAISEGNLASPWKVIEVNSLKDASERVEKLAKEGDFEKMVVGMPEGKMGKKVLGFINLLRKKGLDISEADETLSTKQATLKMIELNISKKTRRINDAYSATIILQNWLDEK